MKLAFNIIRRTLPVFTVEFSDFGVQLRHIIKAREMHTPTLGMRFRLVEAFYTADSAK